MTRARVSAARTCAFSCPPPPTHLVSDVDLAEAEGAEVGVGRLHGRLDRLAEELLHKLTDVGPHLFDRLRGTGRNEDSSEEECIYGTSSYFTSSAFKFNAAVAARGRQLGAPRGQHAADVPARARTSRTCCHFINSRDEGCAHANKRETGARFVTLFSHSTRSTSGKWTWEKGKKRVANIVAPVLLGR